MIREIDSKRIGDILREQKILDSKDILKILKEQEKTGEFFGEIAVRFEMAKEVDILQALIKQFDLPFIDIKDYEIDKKLLKQFSEDLLVRALAIPLEKIGKTWVMAIAGPLEPEDRVELEYTAKTKIYYILTHVASIREIFKENFSKTELSSLGEILLKNGTA